MAPHLRSFARISEHSKEYQGHGWGCALLTPQRQWRVYKNIKPIWQDDLAQFDDTTLLLAHARSAYRNEGICVENNMPFYDDKYVFAFNGELHGVRISERGRIGAEKVFNFVKRFNEDDLQAALVKGVGIIRKRARHVRAMNIVICEEKQIHVSSFFSEDAEYFTMHVCAIAHSVIVCSERYPCGDGAWRAIGNGSVRSF